MKIGEKNRIIRSTFMNAKSSRSHIVFSLALESKFPNENGKILVFFLNS